MSNGENSAHTSKPTTHRTAPETSPRPADSTNARSGVPPPAFGGASRVQRSFTTNPTQEEYADAAARGAYYRKSFSQLGKSNAERNVRRNATGSCRRCGGGTPPPRCAPLAEVREEDMAGGSNYRGRHTPKAVDERRKADRKHGERVYDASNAIMMWIRVAQPRPAPPERPRNPLEGFDDDAIMLDKRGHKLSLKAADVSPLPHTTDGDHMCDSNEDNSAMGAAWNHCIRIATAQSKVNANDGRKPTPKSARHTRNPWTAALKKGRMESQD